MTADVLKALAAMTAGTVVPLGAMWFLMEAAPRLPGPARKPALAARLLFLAAGWLAVIASLML